MKRQLPACPSLIQLRNQAKDLLRSIRAGSPEALSRLREHHRRHPLPDAASLSDAQFVVAREYGFASWPKLKHHVEGLEAVADRVSKLQAEFAAGDAAAKRRLLEPAHTRERFQNYDPDAPSLSRHDARLLIANQEGYAFWQKYESYLHLDPTVQTVIAAVRAGDLKKLREVLNAESAAANPKWVPGFTPSKPIPNDSIPLFCVSEAVFRGTNPHGNEYEIARALIEAGADMTIEGDIVLESAVSFNVIRAAEAMLDAGAPVDGVDSDGVPMAYALQFGHAGMAELLARRGAKLDLRFASGLGRLDLMRNWFHADGSLKPGAGGLADPYGQERKQLGQSPFRCERTRANILSQSLWFACVNRRLEAAEFLLDRGADINAIVPGLDVEAAILHRIRRPETVRFLLEHGADTRIRDRSWNATPIAWASYLGQEDVVDVLIERAGIHDAVVCDRAGRVRMLREQDASLANARDDLGRTPLECVHDRLKRKKEILDLLLAHGANLSAREAV
ncbi:MAG TPA: hypothetical protein VHC72_04460 [Bryobacteraceae bacterium]|nr:hypothetical protein [Bryobacteraceae bacterium]